MKYQLLWPGIPHEFVLSKGAVHKLTITSVQVAAGHDISALLPRAWLE